MTDSIALARKVWCQPYLFTFGANGRVPIEHITCPPEVVSALLSVLEKGCDCPGERAQAMKVIAKALEQKS